MFTTFNKPYNTSHNFNNLHNIAQLLQNKSTTTYITNKHGFHTRLTITQFILRTRYVAHYNSFTQLYKSVHKCTQLYNTLTQLHIFSNFLRSFTKQVSNNKLQNMHAICLQNKKQITQFTNIIMNHTTVVQHVPHFTTLLQTLHETSQNLAKQINNNIQNKRTNKQCFVKHKTIHSTYICVRQIQHLHTTLHNFTKLYNTVHNVTNLYDALHALYETAQSKSTTTN